MRVLCITPYYKPAYVYGGPARSVPSLCEGMAKLGAQVTVFTTNANGPGRFLDVVLNQPQHIDGVEVVYFPLSQLLSKAVPFYSKELRRACNIHVRRFDAVYIPGNWVYTVLAGAKAAMREKIPYVVSPRGSLMDWSLSQKAVKKQFYLALFERSVINGAAVIHVTTALELHQLKKLGFQPTAAVIPNGIDLPLLVDLPTRGSLRYSLSVPPDGSLSLFVGRLHKKKRLDLTIEAFARFAKQRSDAHLLIVGADEDGSRQFAQQQVGRLGLLEQIHFKSLLTGNDLIQAYVDADLLVLLSSAENFGMVVVEGMAHRLPVIVTREVGLSEEVQQVNAGIVVSAKPEDVSAAWQKLLDDVDLREEMGKRAGNLVSERFASDVVATKMLELLVSIVDKERVH